jgi:hypothetical protein
MAKPTSSSRARTRLDRAFERRKAARRKRPMQQLIEQQLERLAAHESHGCGAGQEGPRQ